MNGVTRILIIRLSSIGDIVLTTPVVRMLKQQLEGEVEIHFLIKEQFKSVLEANPHIHQIHTIKDDVKVVIPVLKELDFHYIVDLHKNYRSARVKNDLRVLSFTLDKINVKKWMAVNFGTKLPELHIVDRYLDSVKAFGLKNDQQGLDYFIPTECDVKINEINPSLDTGYLVFVIGGAHIGKRMPSQKISEICSELDFSIVLLGGKEDEQAAKEIIESSHKNVFNAVGKYSINQSASIVQQASVVISGDTGFMHIASAFKKRIISLWGCTIPEFGMSPYQAHSDSLIIEPKQLKKRPCSKLGNRCKYGEDKRCITQIDNKDVIQAANRLMGS